MLPNISEIKTKRIHAALTQSQLAAMAEISQSLIAKIEANQVVPSYNNAKRIFDILDELTTKSKLKAKDIMTKKLISVKASTTIKEAANLMKKHSISQLPIIDNEKLIGTITEKDILTKIHELGDKPDLKKLNVQAIMEEPMPIVPENTSADMLSTMLEDYNAILIGKSGGIAGIVSKSDMLKVLLKK